MSSCAPLHFALAQLLETMKRYGARWMFTGHYHRNNVVEDKEFGVTNVTTSAVGMQLGDDGHGMRLVRVHEDAIEHEYFRLDEFEEKIKSW